MRRGGASCGSPADPVGRPRERPDSAARYPRIAVRRRRRPWNASPAVRRMPGPAPAHGSPPSLFPAWAGARPPRRRPTVRLVSRGFGRRLPRRRETTSRQGSGTDDSVPEPCRRSPSACSPPSSAPYAAPCPPVGDGTPRRRFHSARGPDHSARRQLPLRPRGPRPWPWSIEATSRHGAARGAHPVPATHDRSPQPCRPGRRCAGQCFLASHSARTAAWLWSTSRVAVSSVSLSCAAMSRRCSAACRCPASRSSDR